MQDLQLLLLAGGTYTATQTGAGVDITAGVGGWNPGEGGVPVQARIGVSTAVATGTYSFKLQDSPDNATWTDISPGRLLTDYGGPTQAGVESEVYVGGFVRQRYVRVVETIGGTTPSITHTDVYLQPLTPQLG